LRALQPRRAAAAGVVTPTGTALERAELHRAVLAACQDGVDWTAIEALRNDQGRTARDWLRARLREIGCSLRGSEAVPPDAADLRTYAARTDAEVFVVRQRAK